MMNICGFEAGLDRPFFLIAGPCVIESEQLAIDTSGKLKEITDQLGIPFVYKSSFDKANRSSLDSFRGHGLEEGLRILSEVRRQIQVPVITDVHEDTPLDEVASVVDMLQTPAFLCRQTNFIQNVARQGKPVNLKKGQFLAPWDMKNVVDKARATGNEQILVCERGVSFGYNNLVSDMRSLAVMRETGCPVVLMQPTRYNCQVARERVPEVSVNTYLYWPGRRLQPVWPGCLWRPTQIRPGH
jgi:2-dehydro-3-deoxyphosphooctonate aldolase (KDO 8-P synthase)